MVLKTGLSARQLRAAVVGLLCLAIPALAHAQGVGFGGSPPNPISLQLAANYDRYVFLPGPTGAPQVLKAGKAPKQHAWFMIGKPAGSEFGWGLESYQYPDHFLVVKDGAVSLQRSDGTEAFARAAAFHQRWDEYKGRVALESWAEPGQFLRACGDRLVVDTWAAPGGNGCSDSPWAMGRETQFHFHHPVKVGPDLPRPARQAIAPTRGAVQYIRVADKSLRLHANGGSKPGAEQTLHPCPRASNHPNCQWIFEPSPTRSGAWYLKIKDRPLYLHAHGGTANGAQMTLHPCPKGANHPNCQWIIEDSASRPGKFYLRSAGGALYLHAAGGSNSGAKATLHPCPKSADHPNCQWVME